MLLAIYAESGRFFSLYPPPVIIDEIQRVPALTSYVQVLPRARDPLRGQLFENMVVSDIRKQMFNRGDDARLAFLRTEKGFEIDLMIALGTTVQPVEIKSAMTSHDSLVANLRKFAREDHSAIRPYLVYDGDISMPLLNGNDVGACNFRAFRYSED